MPIRVNAILNEVAAEAGVAGAHALTSIKPKMTGRATRRIRTIARGAGLRMSIVRPSLRLEGDVALVRSVEICAQIVH